MGSSWPGGVWRLPARRSETDARAGARQARLAWLRRGFERSRRWEWAGAVCALVLVGGCWLAHLIAAHLAESVSQKEQSRFEAEAGRWKGFLEVQLASHVRALQGLRDWFALQDRMSERLWTNYFYSLNAAVYYPAFRSFGYVAYTKLDTDSVAAHLTQARLSRGQDYTLHATLPGAVPGHSWYAMALTWFHANVPRGAAEPTFRDYGQDWNQVPELWAAMNWALGQDRPAVGAPLRLEEATATSATVPLFLPVYRRDMDHSLRIEPNPWVLARARTAQEAQDTHDEERALRFLRGLVVGLVDFPELLGRQAQNFPPGFGLRVSVNDQQGKPHLVYASAVPDAAPTSHHHGALLRYGGRDWGNEATAGPRFEALSGRQAYWLTAGGGWAVSLLLTGFVANQVRARREQERAAEALREARNTLQDLLLERQRLSRDLHDKTIQSIYATRLGLSLCRNRLTGPEPRLAELLSNCELTLEQAIQELRRFINAREPEPEPATLVSLDEALGAIAEHMRPLFAGTIHVAVDRPLARRLPPRVVAELLCIAREAVSNSLRHAQARRIELLLEPEGEGALLRVSDDGLGFEADPQGADGMGLRNIAARAEELGGELRVTKPGSGGAVLEVHVPLAEDESA